MPTQLHRAQVLLQPEAMAQVRTLANENRRTISAMCAELIEFALQGDQYQEQLGNAEVAVSPQPDPRGDVPQIQTRVSPQAEAIATLLDLIDDGKLDALLKKKAIAKL